MKELIAGSGGIDSRTLKSNLKMISWMFIWTATMVLVDKALLYEWISSTGMIVAAVGVNTGLGFAMIVAFMRYLKESVELQRKIQLDALAISMGIGLVGSFTYSLLVTAGFIVDSEVSDIILLMSVTYMIGITVGQVRYR